MDDDGFYMAELRGQRGLVPSNFLTDAPNQGKSLLGGMLGGLTGGNQGGITGPPPPPRGGMMAGKKGRIGQTTFFSYLTLYTPSTI